MTEQKTKRILCIDGGGVKGIFPAAFLSGIDEKLEGGVAGYFDLIVGTSTGGIIALGLGLGVRSSELLEFYREYAPKIFGDSEKSLFSFLTSRPKYSTTILREALAEIMGDKVLGDSRNRLVVPAWNCTQRCPYIYKTAHHLRYDYDYETPVLDVALATSAAPHYFSEHRTSNSQTLLDGGLFANNPLAVAVTEAVGVLDWDKDSLKILSLGTTRAVRKKRRIWRLCLYGYLTYQIDQILDAQERSSLAMGRLLSGDRGNNSVYRIDQQFADGEYELDRTDNLHELEGLGFSKAREHFHKMREIFFSEKAELFTPKYTP